MKTLLEKINENSELKLKRSMRTYKNLDLSLCVFDTVIEKDNAIYLIDSCAEIVANDLDNNNFNDFGSCVSYDLKDVKTAYPNKPIIIVSCGLFDKAYTKKPFMNAVMNKIDKLISVDSFDEETQTHEIAVTKSNCSFDIIELSDIDFKKYIATLGPKFDFISMHEFETLMNSIK